MKMRLWEMGDEIFSKIKAVYENAGDVGGEAENI